MVEQLSIYRAYYRLKDDYDTVKKENDLLRAILQACVNRLEEANIAHPTFKVRTVIQQAKQALEG